MCRLSSTRLGRDTGDKGVLIKRASGGPSRASVETPASDRVLRSLVERLEGDVPSSSVPDPQWLPRDDSGESTSSDDDGGDSDAEEFRLLPRRRPRS